MSEQTFTISPAKAINHTRLEEEIKAAVANYTSSQAFYNSSNLATSFLVKSPSALSGGDQTTIANLIAAHTPTPLPNVDEFLRQYHVKTADATPTPIISTTPGHPNFVADVPQHSILHIEYLLIAVKTDESAYKKWHGEIAVSRGGNGAAWPGPGTFDDYFVKTIGAITASRTGALSGNKPIVTVTGQAGVSIQWSLYTRTIKYTL